jgi:hypothetical protein
MVQYYKKTREPHEIGGSLVENSLVMCDPDRHCSLMCWDLQAACSLAEAVGSSMLRRAHVASRGRIAGAD